MKKYFLFSAFCSLLMLPYAAAQTFEIGGQPAEPAKSGKKATPRSGAPASSGGIGWGSSIEVGRMARAAEDSLRRGNYSAAATYAKRAVDAAPGQTKLWFLYGYTARMAGRFNESVSAYKRGLANEPGNADGLSGLAQTYAKMGNTNEAKRLLAQVLRNNPNRATDLLVAGELYIRSGDVKQGLAYLERAESLKPSSHSELLMATAYLKLKDPERAKVLLDKAKRRDPKNVNIFRAVATYYREERDYKSAIATLKAAPRMNADVLGDLGFTYEVSGDAKNAAAAYARAAEAEPGRIQLHLSAAQAYYRTGDLDKSRAFIARAEKIDADHYRLHAIKAGIARSENRTDEAIREFNLALSRMPEDRPEGALYPIQLRLNLGELYKSTGNDAAAQEQMRIAEAEINKIEVGGEAKAEFLRVRASIRANSEDFAGAEADLKEALQLDGDNPNIQLQYANLLWRTGRKGDAQKLLQTVLAKDPKNRFALEGMGYLARDAGDTKTAEQYFTKLAAVYPDDHVAFLALGDMYATMDRYDDAEVNYQKAFKIAPQNASIVAGATNSAIEAGKFDIARQWIDRATASMNDDPRIIRERARVLFHEGQYLASAQLARKALEKLPKDRNAAVYLAYDLYNLGRFDDVLSLATKYEAILDKEANFPLLAGHVHKQSQLLDSAVDDYSRALERDPNMVEALVNRGYVLNDLQNAEAAIQDFDAALKIAPNNGVAHLGKAFSALQLRQARSAHQHLDDAERLLGQSGATHLARATAYRQQRLLDRAEREYRAAIKFNPDDAKTHLALADTLFHARQYRDAVSALNDALRLSPDDPFIYAQMAHAHAKLGDTSKTFAYIEEAERAGVTTDQLSDIYLATGDALLTLGDRDAAMERFALALDAPDSNRVDARLAVARVFVRDGHWEDAKQQIAFAFAESRIGEAAPLTADHMVDAANLFLGMHDFNLATQYFERARELGAADQVVAVGLANAYLAQGDSVNAEAMLNSMGNVQEYEQNYDYVLAMGNIYRQRGQNERALGMFAKASALAGDDDVAVRQMHEVAALEGVRIRENLNMGSDVTMSPIFENATIYMLDAKLFGVADQPGLMPLPRASYESRVTTAYNYRHKGWPALSGFVQLRNANGQISLPSENLILDRNTMDTSFNTGVTPVLRFGRNRITMNTGIQFTLRRDRGSPVEMNQNLFRQFLHMSTSPFFNWISLRGSAFHEAGPFTSRSLNSRELGAHLEFTVGRPWGNNAMVTGYSVRDLQFSPLVREFFTTSTWAGYQRKFGQTATITVLGEYVRSWRVQELTYAIAQGFVPRAQVDWNINRSWSVNSNFALFRGMGFHAYDNVQSGILISYMKPLRQHLPDGIGGIVPVEYPIRISFGVQQEMYPNFAGRGTANIRPIIRVSLF